MTTKTCHKQGKEEQVDSNPGVNSEPLQVVQPESERESIEPSDIRGIIYNIFNSYTLKFCCTANVATQSYSYRSSL